MIRLFTSYYEDKKLERQIELNHCLARNIENVHIQEIWLICEDGKRPPNADPFGKIKFIDLNRRPTYQDFFQLINDVSSPVDIALLANTDIYFDHTLADLPAHMNGNKCIALSRWDVKPEGAVLHNCAGSQDTWIFQGKVKKVKYASFNLGIPGCDNRIAWELHRAGYLMKNPATTIKSYHYHPSDLHNYLDEKGENIQQYRGLSRKFLTSVPHFS